MTKRTLLALVLMLNISCAALKTPHPVVAGGPAASSFDSGTYNLLVFTNSVIEQTKADLSAGNVFTPAATPIVKQALNALITSYNSLDTFYQTYHKAVVAGTATPAQAAAVTNATAQVNASLTGLTSAKAGAQ